MERDTQTLNTRDLASSGEAGGDVRTSEGGVREAAAVEGQPELRDRAAVSEGQPELRDRAAVSEESTPLPADEETRLPAEERARAATDEHPRLPDEQPARPDEALTGASTGDQTVETDSPQASVGIGGAAEGRLATSEPEPGPAEPSPDQEMAAASTGAATSASDAGASLLAADMDARFQEDWKEIQTRFVDQPREAVEDADRLVANLMQQLAEGFAKERERLEAQWGRGEDISTEDLRVALQRYRTFFQRLLST